MNTLCETIPANGNEVACENPARARQPGQLYRRILVATDFSSASNTAFEQGLGLAKHDHAELLVAHAAAPPSWINFMAPEAYREWEEQCRAGVRKNLGELIQRAHKEGVKAHMVLFDGLSGKAIVNLAERLEIDLVVVGVHCDPKGPWRFARTAVERLVSHVPCAVLTAR